MCKNEECPNKNTCFRYRAKPNPYRQSYFLYNNHEDCKEFISIKGWADYALTPIKVTHEILRQNSKWEGEPIDLEDAKKMLADVGIDWNEDRIDTIGQNGNEGLHY
jgi:hypothetical protein